MEPSEQAAPPADSQTTQQIEDKLAKLFEDGPTDQTNKPVDQQPKAADETQDSTEGDEAPALEEVELDGEKYQVPAKLKEAIIHKSDYTRKTQEVAEARRQIELQGEAFKLAQAENAFAQTIDEPLRNLAILDARTKELLGNWQKLSPDEKSELLYLDKQREMVTNDIKAKRSAFDQDQQKAISDLRAKCADAVRKSIPGWSDDLAKEITKHAMDEGYTQQELSNISDPRHVKTLWKAREYDRLKAKATAPANKVAPVAKAVGTNPMPQKVKDDFAYKKAMGQAKTPGEKARLIEAKLARGFK